MITVKNLVDRLKVMMGDPSHPTSKFGVLLNGFEAEQFLQLVEHFDRKTNLVAVFGRKVYDHIVADPSEFKVEPAAREDVAERGFVGTLHGIRLFTTAFLDPAERLELDKVIRRGLYVLEAEEETSP